MNIRTVCISVLLLLAASACGGSSDGAVATASSGSSGDGQSAPASDGGSDSSPSSDDLVPVDEAVEDLLDSNEEAFEDLADTLEQTQDAVGGGSMVLTVGDETWTFEPVLCAFGPEQIGQEGAEFVLSSIQDGKQMYVSIDSFGHSVSLDDIEDFANPSVSVSTFGGGEFIMLDGKSFSGSAEFLDDTSDSFETIAGTFSGTCP